MLRDSGSRDGRSARGTPSLRHTLRRHPVLFSLLTLVILSQTGCQSGPFGPCGPCGDNPFRQFRERIFNRPGRHFGGGGTIISEVPVYEGAPPAVVAPAPVLTPAPGAALPAPSEVAPQIEPLEPVPSATPGVESSGTQGARAPTGKVNYEASRPREKIGLSNGSKRFSRNSVQTTPVPTSRSAPGSLDAPAPVVATTKRVEPRNSDLSLLDNLPPLDLPRDRSRPEDQSATAPVTEGADRLASVPAPVMLAENEKEAFESGPVAREPEPEAEPALRDAAPGLRKFAVVEPKLAGGSFPTAEGLDWLVEKGYRTLVDLREPSEIEPSIIAAAAQRGMRYVSLPIGLTTVDQDHVNRFHFEISLADARPIYFFDAEGNRSGMLWYIHRMTDTRAGYDTLEASRESEELGLTADEFRKAAEKYVRNIKAQPVSMMPVETTVSTTGEGPSAPSDPAPASDPTAPAHPAPEKDQAHNPAPVSGIPAKKPEALAESPVSSPSRAATSPEHASATTPTPAPTTTTRSATPPPAAPAGGLLRDPDAWRPFLALLLTALGVPCAYWSRSIFSFRGPRRASLAGPGRRPRSLPAASGE